MAEVWTDPSVDWSSYDAVLLRSVWDYHVRYLEFTEWLGQLDKAGVPVLNETDLVRWNADKQYLLELRERGVGIVPSQVAAGPLLRDVLNGLNGQQVVIKPTVSATAHFTIRGTAGSEELSRAMDDLPDTVYLVQPFQPEIQSEGEWSLIFVDGEFTHAVLKRPADGDYRVQDDFGGTAELLEAAGRSTGRCGRGPRRSRHPSLPRLRPRRRHPRQRPLPPDGARTHRALPLPPPLPRSHHQTRRRSSRPPRLTGPAQDCHEGELDGGGDHQADAQAVEVGPGGYE